MKLLNGPFELKHFLAFFYVSEYINPRITEFLYILLQNQFPLKLAFRMAKLLAVVAAIAVAIVAFGCRKPARKSQVA